MQFPQIQKMFLSVCLFASLLACKKDEDNQEDSTTTTQEECAPSYSFNVPSSGGPHLIFKFHFDSTQARLNNIGVPTSVPAGHAAQSPLFNGISQHYVELAGDFDQLGGGVVLYVGEETNAGGDNAIQYCASTITSQDEIFFSKPISEITPGTYKWLRTSLAYQNYDILYKSALLPGNQTAMGTIASFVGFNTYITSYEINGENFSPSADAGGPGNHTQGYWGFLTTVNTVNYFLDGQAPAGATTVPNPFVNSPIPAGSCVVTGQFVDDLMTNSPLVITGTETEDIVITISLSTNKSFEWIEVTPDGYFQPEIGEAVIDMGLRGLIPIKN